MEQLLDTIKSISIYLDSRGALPTPLPIMRELTPEDTSPFKEELKLSLCRLLKHRFRYYALYLMFRLNVLDAVLPEVKALYGVPQPPQFHPEGDVFRHTALTLHFLKNPTCGVAFAALLHDVGKPTTFEVKERIRFDSHNTAALPLIHRIAERLHMDDSTKRLCLFVAKEHMRLLDIRKMRLGRLKNFLSHQLFPQLLEIWYADVLASHGDTEDYHFARRKYEEYLDELRRPPPLLTGSDLIREGYTPGPLFKRILFSVNEAHKLGIINTYKEAIRFVRNTFKLTN